VRIVLLLVNIYLGFEYCLAVLARGQTGWESHRYHAAICCLLLDRDDDFPVLSALLAEEGVLHGCEALGMVLWIL